VKLRLRNYALEYKKPKRHKYNPMKLFTEGTIKIVEKNNFSDQEGKTVEFYTVFLKNEDGEVLEINSGKEDFSNMEGEYGVATINARKRDGGGYKLSLVAFKKAEKETITF